MRLGPRAWPVCLLGLLAAQPPSRLAAQATDPTGSWRTLETTHFRVHTRAAWRELGVRAAVEAESAYAALAGLLPPPRRRIDLVVTDHFDLSNGFATTYPLPRVVIYAAPPAGDVQLGYYDRWLRLVITHELAHVFHLDPARGWWGVARRVFGRAPPLFPNLYAPSWLTEGLAVFYESRLTEGGRLDGGLHHVVLRAQNAERGVLPLDAAGGLSPRWPAGVRPYAFGSAFFAALADHHGDTAVARLVRAQSSRLLPFVQLPQAVRIATGSGFREAWAEAQADAVEWARGGGETGAEGGRVLLARQRSFVPARVGEGGRVLALHDDGRDAPRLVVIADGRQRSLGRVNYVTGLAWDTGGAALVSQLEFTRATEVRSDLWRVTLDGRTTRLTRGERLVEADVARDGAIVAVRLVHGGSELVLLEHGETRVLGAPSGGVEWAQPRFAPDGRTIAVVRVQAGVHDVVLVDRAGAQRSLTADLDVDRMPAFADAGRTVIWSREEGGVPVIVAAPVDGGVPHVVARAPFAAWGPDADGDSLLYLSYHADGLRLVKVARRDGGEVAPAQPVAAGAAQPPPDTTLIRAEHRYRPWPALLPQYWLPIGSSELGATFFGVFSSSADPLGRHAWVASVQVGSGISAGSWRGQVAYAYARFSPLLLDAFYERDQLVYAVQPPGGGPLGPLQCCIADETVQLGATLVRRRWRSSVSTRGAVEYDRTGSAERWGVIAAVSAANAVRPALGISSQQGSRAAASVRYRWRPGLDRTSTEYVARLSLYHAWPTGGFARQVTAVRMAGGTITGTDNLRFAVGGANEESASLLPGIVVGGGARTFPLRGAAPGDHAGRTAASLALEHRVPLALVGRGLPWLLPAELDRLSVSVFGDGAFASTAGADSSFASTGLELVLDLGVGAAFPLRARLGFAQRLDLDRRTAYVAVGSSF